ncbi:MAG: DoxX family membrane protein [Bacteroidales bacterium]
MRLPRNKLDAIEASVTRWSSANGIRILRISIGVIFLWYGALKLFEGMSPAEDLAVNTIEIITFHLLSPKTIIYILAIWEVIIGVGLLLNIYLRITLLLLFLQMLGTFTPLFFFTEETFRNFPYALTLEGQYIIKNIVIISAGIVLMSTLRRGKHAKP